MPMGCAVWGVLNVTPDSFSDGGVFVDEGAAFAHAERMWSEGANVIDVGGESTRPAGQVYGSGYAKVDAAEEVRRVLPVVRRMVQAGMVVSIDTTKPQVAREALAAGARYVNDVSGGADAELLSVVREADADVVLMHNRDRGQVVESNTHYSDVVEEVLADLSIAVERAVDVGISRNSVWIDPGIGFAKDAAQSGELLSATARFVRTGQRVLVGASRKSFIAHLVGDESLPQDRLGGSIAAVTIASLAGAQAVRVHDVAASHQATRLVHALRPAQGVPWS